ncbi:MAG: hypothetical protein C0392_03550 [Syntrophus sp. (in: bacteria)]|nr:hypothetical protein [Syntrophus sp. (in: bacteria)]
MQCGSKHCSLRETREALMKLCVFSDIHGNGPAFRVAYPMILNEKADINLFLGDLCGYFFDQKEIFSLLRNIPNFKAIKGNHDEILLKVLSNNIELEQTYLAKYGISIKRLIDEGAHEIADWLSELPDSFLMEDLKMACYHGSSLDKLEGRIYPDTPVDEFIDCQPSLFILGHTHYRLDRRVEDKIILNPGSVGQPRDGEWPTYMVLLYPSMEVTFRSIRYNKNELIRQIGKLDGSNRYLREVILR